jgi:hypothetical protein
MVDRSGRYRQYVPVRTDRRLTDQAMWRHPAGLVRRAFLALDDHDGQSQPVAELHLGTPCEQPADELLYRCRCADGPNERVHVGSTIADRHVSIS